MKGGKIIKAPFPWFGGKSRAAGIIWDRLGNTQNYVEPFAGSLAVLLSRPHEAKIETVNDLDCYLSNFWRSVSIAPRETAKYADWPVNEADLLARHKWLVAQSEFINKIKSDPLFYDPKIAGWWVWGLCSWIGSGWCAQKEKQSEQIPHLGTAGQGINRKLPHLGDAGRDEKITEYFVELFGRLRNVRVCCGDWSRCLGDSVTFKLGLTSILLDPPYSADLHNVKYSAESENISHDVCKWAIENGENPLLRIALCGYEGEHIMPKSWECVEWKATGGFGSQSNSRGRDNANLERIWFSPNCLKTEKQGKLL